MYWLYKLSIYYLIYMQNPYEKNAQNLEMWSTLDTDEIYFIPPSSIGCK